MSEPTAPTGRPAADGEQSADVPARSPRTPSPAAGADQSPASARRRRLRALLNTPEGLRQALLAQAILDPPEAVRPRARRRRPPRNS